MFLEKTNSKRRTTLLQHLPYTSSRSIITVFVSATTSGSCGNSKTSSSFSASPNPSPTVRTARTRPTFPAKVGTAPHDERMPPPLRLSFRHPKSRSAGTLMYIRGGDAQKPLHTLQEERHWQFFIIGFGGGGGAGGGGFVCLAELWPERGAPHLAAAVGRDGRSCFSSGRPDFHTARRAGRRAARGRRGRRASRSQSVGGAAARIAIRQGCRFNRWICSALGCRFGSRGRRASGYRPAGGKK